MFLPDTTSCLLLGSRCRDSIFLSPFILSSSRRLLSLVKEEYANSEVIRCCCYLSEELELCGVESEGRDNGKNDKSR